MPDEAEVEFDPKSVYRFPNKVGAHKRKVKYTTKKKGDKEETYVNPQVRLPGFLKRLIGKKYMVHVGNIKMTTKTDFWGNIRTDTYEGEAVILIFRPEDNKGTR